MKLMGRNISSYTGCWISLVAPAALLCIPKTPVGQHWPKKVDGVGMMELAWWSDNEVCQGSSESFEIQGDAQGFGREGSNRSPGLQSFPTICNEKAKARDGC